MATDLIIEDEREIKLKLDSYNDLFSDFDPRPYSVRALSEDFLTEAKKASYEKEDIILNLMVPKEKRVIKDEIIIKKRLKQHFSKHYYILNKKVRRKIIHNGELFISFGIFIMLIASIIMFKFPETNIITSFLIVLLEPAGWFLFWEGLNLIIFESKKTEPELEFYRKMSNAKIIFSSY